MSRASFRSLSDSNGIGTQKHLVHKRTLSHLAKWLSVRLRTKWLWVRIPLRSIKIWVDQGSEFYNSSFKKWLKENHIEMYSTYTEGKLLQLKDLLGLYKIRFTNI